MQTQTLGNNSIAIQIAGDGNIVTVNGIKGLVLNRLHDRRTDPETIIDLLRTDIRAVDLIGRDSDLAALAQWRDSDRTIAVRCLTGRAGSGKTRLAIEACERAEASGWTAAFVSGDELRRFHTAAALGHWTFSGKLLLVVDYAASAADILKTWFAILAPSRKTPGQGTLRILLLERQADTQSGWWQELLRRDSLSQASAADLIGAETPIPLLPLSQVEDRRALLTAVMACAAPLLDKPVVAPPPPGRSPAFDSQLAKNLIDNEPLYLLMAGVHAVDSGAPAALALGRLDLAERMTDIECARITRWACNNGYTDKGELLLHLCACVTLRNGCAFDDLEALVWDEAAAMGFTAPKSFERVANDLIQCLSATPEHCVDAIRPDLIGETFLTRIILGHSTRSEKKCNGVIQRALARAEDSVISALVRTAQDLAVGSVSHPSVRWLRFVVDSFDIDQLARIADALPQQTLALRELACDITIQLTDFSRSLLSGNAEATNLFAYGLIDLSARLNSIGRFSEALTAAEEAVTHCRGLVSNSSKSFNVGLAACLNNLSIRLGTLGRKQLALKAAEESVDIRIELAKSNPNYFLPDLAGSLSNLINAYLDLKQPGPALQAAEETMAIYRALFLTHPDLFGNQLAGSLMNTAICLSALGRHEEALTVAEESVVLRRDLAAAHPDAFVPDLAMSLNNLAICLSALDCREAALVTAEEVVIYYRNLSAAHSVVFVSDLVKSLSILGNYLEAAGQIRDAVVRDIEAMNALLPHFMSQPVAFSHLMNSCLKAYIRRAKIAEMNMDNALISAIWAVLGPLVNEQNSVRVI